MSSKLIQYLLHIHIEEIFKKTFSVVHARILLNDLEKIKLLSDVNAFGNTLDIFLTRFLLGLAVLKNK